MKRILKAKENPLSLCNSSKCSLPRVGYFLPRNELNDENPGFFSKQGSSDVARKIWSVNEAALEWSFGHYVARGFHVRHSICRVFGLEIDPSGIWEQIVDSRKDHGLPLENLRNCTKFWGKFLFFSRTCPQKKRRRRTQPGKKGNSKQLRVFFRETKPKISSTSASSCWFHFSQHHNVLLSFSKTNYFLAGKLAPAQTGILMEQKFCFSLFQNQR